jgi:uncharacterized protein
MLQLHILYHVNSIPVYSILHRADYVRGSMNSVTRLFAVMALLSPGFADEASDITIRANLEMEHGNRFAMNMTGVLPMPEFEMLDTLTEYIQSEEIAEIPGCPTGLSKFSLLDAVTEGSVHLIECLLSIDGMVQTIDRTDPLGNTPLILAVMDDMQDITEKLLASGADVNAANIDGNTALLLASSLGHAAVVPLLIENGADIHAVDINGNTALILSAAYGFGSVVSHLISKGADVHAKNHAGRTAAMHAVDFQYLEIVDILKEEGAESPISFKSLPQVSIEAIVAAASADAIATEARVHAEKEAELRRTVLLEIESKEERSIFDAVAKTRRQDAKREAKQLLHAEEERILNEQRARKEEASEHSLSEVQPKGDTVAIGLASTIEETKVSAKAVMEPEERLHTEEELQRARKEEALEHSLSEVQPKGDTVAVDLAPTIEETQESATATTGSEERLIAENERLLSEERDREWKALQQKLSKFQAKDDLGAVELVSTIEEAEESATAKEPVSCVYYYSFQMKIISSAVF